MTIKYLLTSTLVLLSCVSGKCQQLTHPYVGTIKEEKTAGISIPHLDSLYLSAIHIDSTKAVFKSKEESDSLMHCYTRFLREFGRYLRQNDFNWEQTTRCWNRIYFNAGGAVDYYLFDFKTPISDEKMTRFKALFTSFAETHKIGITAKVNFAQCSPVTYTDK